MGHDPPAVRDALQRKRCFAATGRVRKTQIISGITRHYADYPDRFVRLALCLLRWSQLRPAPGAGKTARLQELLPPRPEYPDEVMQGKSSPSPPRPVQGVLS